ncbi:MAG: hypothetical protein COW71_10795 [Ignavibacteriales bacterium CG18_big_fil_WC_8_21_14_2_50_31_20]|nr:MAG: hypothetical protein COW71_10795 [Ignavibacteriales bacterium CG18_big_fil_WC_8_21_14_2_50_31_20]
MDNILNAWYFGTIIVPILIILAKIIDVSLGTLRIILVSKGSKSLAPFLGFFEVLVWIIAIGQVMQNLTNPINYVAYALGFALGNYFGILLEGKLALGQVIVRVISKRDASELIEVLKTAKYGITIVDAIGSTGPVHMIFTVIKRSQVGKVVNIIKEYNPRAFYSIEDIRYVSETNFGTILPEKGSWFRRTQNKKK